MAKPPPPPAPKPPGEDDEPLITGFYESPPSTQIDSSKQLPDLVPVDSQTDPQWASDRGLRETVALEEERPPRRSPSGLKIAAIVAVIAIAGAGALAYRGYHRKQVLAQGVARARQLVASDTYGGFRDAAQILEPLVPIDPIQAGSLRAFALAMLAADYRDEDAAIRAEGLLLQPERAPTVPQMASLARAALALSRREVGTATTFVSRASGPWAPTLAARMSLAAGNLSGAAESLDAALAVDPRFPAALALRGDVLRRRKDSDGARTAYARALEASPSHARAAFGMGKLALSGVVPPPQAIPHLLRLVGDRAGTADNERARAALHLAALLGRAGDRAGAAQAIEAAGVDPASRAWLERAAAQEEAERGPYRVVDGAPTGLRSASDDDPYVPPPPLLAAPAVEKQKPARHAAATTKTKSRTKAKATTASTKTKVAKSGKSKAGSAKKTSAARSSKKTTKTTKTAKATASKTKAKPRSSTTASP